jgi:hypothetical protein
LEREWDDNGDEEGEDTEAAASELAEFEAMERSTGAAPSARAGGAPPSSFADSEAWDDDNEDDDDDADAHGGASGADDSFASAGSGARRGGPAAAPERHVSFAPSAAAAKPAARAASPSGGKATCALVQSLFYDDKAKKAAVRAASLQLPGRGASAGRGGVLRERGVAAENLGRRVDKGRLLLPQPACDGDAAERLDEAEPQGPV